MKAKKQSVAVAPWIRKLEDARLALGKERDALRLVYEDMESLLETTDDGIRLLSDAIDRLSELA